jgi:hypothetical protein
MTCWKLKQKLMECIEKKGELDILFNDQLPGRHAVAGDHP